MAEKQWRPEKGWDAAEIAKPIKQAELVGRWVSQLDVNLVEAAADAMLEALRDARFPYPGGQFAGIDITKEGDFLIILKS